MSTYQITCSNGWTDSFKAKSLLGAKMRASNILSHGCGNLTLHAPDGHKYTRRFWDGVNTFGWDKWVEVELDY